MSSRTYTLGKATRALTPTGGFLKGFAYSLNPYVGCAFGDAGGCPFCYVRALVVARAKGARWGSWVVAKVNLKERLLVELAAMEQAGKLARTAVFMSSATDPYQGLERRLGITRGALEAFLRYPVRRLVLQTRSPLIERDLGLLQRMGERVMVSLTLETDDETVRRALTPTSPSVGRRLRTARAIRAAGIPVQLAIAPMMPNHPERFARLAAEVADRVVVDTYFDGDGAGGRRSRALGMGELYARLGYERWFRPGAERPLIDALKARFGEAGVLFSCEGFNTV